MNSERAVRDSARGTRGRTLVWVAAGWVIGTLVLQLAGQWLAETLWIGAMLIDAGWVALGVLLLAFSGFMTFRLRAWEPAIATGVLVVALYSAFMYGGYVTHAGAEALKQFRFQHNLASYQRTVAMVRRTGAKHGYHEGGIDFVVDSGPPVRVAFPWPGGILDNWQGIVYDPTGRVLKATEYGRNNWSTGGDPEVGAMANLFGGDMFYCELVRRPWYFCQFS